MDPNKSATVRAVLRFAHPDGPGGLPDIVDDSGKFRVLGELSPEAERDSLERRQLPPLGTLYPQIKQLLLKMEHPLPELKEVVPVDQIGLNSEAIAEARDRAAVWLSTLDQAQQIVQELWELWHEHPPGRSKDPPTLFGQADFVIEDVPEQRVMTLGYGREPAPAEIQFLLMGLMSIVDGYLSGRVRVQGRCHHCRAFLLKYKKYRRKYCDAACKDKFHNNRRRSRIS